jgi:hypothetical protein
LRCGRKIGLATAGFVHFEWFELRKINALARIRIGDLAAESGVTVQRSLAMAVVQHGYAQLCPIEVSTGY